MSFQFSLKGEKNPN